MQHTQFESIRPILSKTPVISGHMWQVSFLKRLWRKESIQAIISGPNSSISPTKKIFLEIAVDFPYFSPPFGVTLAVWSFSSYSTHQGTLQDLQERILEVRHRSLPGGVLKTTILVGTVSEKKTNAGQETKTKTTRNLSQVLTKRTFCHLVAFRAT